MLDFSILSFIQGRPEWLLKDLVSWPLCLQYEEVRDEDDIVRGPGVGGEGEPGGAGGRGGELRVWGEHRHHLWPGLQRLPISQAGLPAEVSWNTVCLSHGTSLLIFRVGSWSKNTGELIFEPNPAYQSGDKHIRWTCAPSLLTDQKIELKEYYHTISYLKDGEDVEKGVMNPGESYSLVGVNLGNTNYDIQCEM